ncbi:MAG: helical backbone metal receptor [Kiritimatiellia bacterium]
MKNLFAVFLVAVCVPALSTGAEDTPRRVVCLAPNYVETLIDLGLRDRIVGVTTSSDYLDEVKTVERVGLYAKPGLEKIVSLEPDLVLCASFVGQKKTAERLKEMGIRVEVYETKGIEEIISLAEGLGGIFAVRKRSSALISRMRESIKEMKKKAETLPRPRVYVEAGYDPMFTCGAGSFVHEMIGIAGGVNIAGDVKKPFPMISSEFVVSRNPEVIILPYMERDYSKENMMGRNGWRHISAVKNGRVYDDIGFNTITIPSPRLILNGLKELFERIHPDDG